MNQVSLRRRTARIAALALSTSALVGLPSARAVAQCTVLAPATKFDPPSSGLPSYLHYMGGQGGLGLGGASGAKRLAVRYNYGFLVYSLASPGAPVRTSIEDLLGGDRYPKSGDGQDRVGPLTLSADGTRALLPWTDPTAYGTVAMASTGGNFSSGGDYLPTGEKVWGVAVHAVGSRYVAFSATSAGIYAADITSATADVGPSQKNGIASEVVQNAGVSGATGITTTDAAGRSYAVAWAADTVSVIDITTLGPPASGLTTSFTSRAYTKSALGVGGSYITAVAAAAHPVTDELYILAEGSSSLGGGNFASGGVTLNRVDPSTGALTLVGSYQPPTGSKRSQKQISLLPFDTELVAVFLEGKDAGGLQPEVHSSADFSSNLAASVAPLTGSSQALSLVAMRTTGGTIYLYFVDALASYLASLDCSTAPSPATASLTVDKIAYSGGTVTSVPDGGSVFIGDQIRIKPIFSPTDAVSPLTQWRLDYDFHDGNAVDSNPTTYRVKSPDLAYSTGVGVPTQLTVLGGPCDPQGGAAATPSTGDGCWTSVTTNGTYTVSASPDFDPVAPADATLTIGFEVQNALNGASSSLKKHNVKWVVPKQALKSSSSLSGGTLEDASEGSPAATGFRWYLAAAPVGQAPGDTTLTLVPSCTGPTCVATGFTTPGNYRYWVSVPYRGGFRTAECPGLAGDTCTGDASKVVTVTDVVLSLTAPTQALVGAPTVTITSSSQKGAGVTPCPATGAANGFSYNVCTVSGGTCAEGTYVTTGLSVASAFPGSFTIPTPSEGTKGLRIRYSYTTDGTCTSPKVAQWPATGYSPLTVLLATPTILLRNSSNTANIPKSLGIYWELTTGQTARAYAQLNGVTDTNPPAGLSWVYRPSGTSSETAIGTTQGAAFAISAVGEYEIVLRGYGTDVVNIVGVSSPTGGGGGSGGSGGGGGSVLTVSSVSVSTTTPTVGQAVSITCNASGGTAPYSYDFVFGDGTTYSGSSRTVSHSYSSAGPKTLGCAVNDSAGAYTNQKVTTINVQAGSGGSCEFVIKNPQGTRISYDSSMQRYDATSGQPLTFEASNVTSAVSWNFGNGQTGSGNPAAYTYTDTQRASYTVTMTSGTCSKSYGIDITPPAGPTFAVSDESTGAPLAAPTGAWEARAGQSLKFTATGTVGAVYWDFGDFTSSTDASPVHTYAAAVDTTYVVTLASNGKTNTGNILVKGSTGAPLTGTFTYKYSDGTAVNRAAVEPNKAVTFTAADLATTYTWDFGDGTALGTGSPKEHVFTRGGTFTVKLTVARDGVLGSTTTPSPLAFTVKPPPDPLLWVAAGMAFADGAGGAKWQSDLSIFNPGTQTATVSLAFVPGSTWDGVKNVTWVQQALVAGETKSYTSILETFFHAAKPAWGVVLVRGDNIPVSPVIVSRTYNGAFADSAGTYGLSVPAMSVANGVKPQSVAGANVLAGLRHDEAFRTNLTVANLKDEEAMVEVVFRDAAGATLGVPAKLTVEPRGVKQLNAALSAGPDVPIGGAGYTTPVSHFSAEVKITKGSGVYPYATVIDQGTGDSVVVTPAPRPSSTYRLPGIVRTAFWKSDVVILNPSAKERKVRVSYSYIRSGSSKRATIDGTVTFKPWETQVGLDFVKVWLGLADDDTADYVSSFVDVSPAVDDAAPTEPVIVSGKTYTVVPGVGTSGLQVDPYVYEDGIGKAASSKRILMSGLESNADSRTNVALFLTPGAGLADSAEVDVNVYDFLGRKLRSVWVQLNADKPIAQLSNDELFAGLTTTDAERASIVIDNPRGAARVGAYATVIDRRSLDATFVAGQPVP